MGNLSRLAALSAEEKWLLVTAAALLPLADLALRLFGYQRTQKALARSVAARKAPSLSRADRSAEAQRTARCVRIAARKSPLRATCLRESLVTWLLLRRRGIAATITLGVGKEAGDFRAHAWVEVDGAPVSDGAGTEPAYASIHRAGSTDSSSQGDSSSR